MPRGYELCMPRNVAWNMSVNVSPKWEKNNGFREILPRCGMLEKIHGLLQKIQGTYFEISALYFKIHGLYFSTFQMSDRQ